MFYSIFKQELSYWFTKPLFYIYCTIFLIAALMVASISAGIFDEVSAAVDSTQIVNSPSAITGMFNTLSTLIIFLYPTIFGMSVYRDFTCEMHKILYSYPFTKANYLSAKFLSALLIVSIIVLFIGIGLAVGFVLPGTNDQLTIPFDLIAYVHVYAVYTLPNALLYGSIVFAVVLFSRNLTVGFVTVIVLSLIQGLTDVLLQDPENRILAAYFDPFGYSATQYYAQYWTVAERNELYLPFTGLILYNRALWLSIAALVSWLVYRSFYFGQQALSFSFRKKSSKRGLKSNFGNITQVRLPRVVYDFSFLQNLKMMWRLSNVDLKFIIKSRPFILLSAFGLIMIIVEHSQANVVRGTGMLPVTSKMLRYSEAFQFAMIVCTFLYTGLLIQRAKTTQMLHLVDTTPVQNWMLIGSKFIAITKIQLVMLLMVMVSGIVFQLYKGYYDFEIDLYAIGLFGTNLWQFVIWTLLAFLIQTLVRNAYVGTFILITLFMAFATPLLAMIGIEQDVFVYGRGPGTWYSDMNGFGESLSAFYAYIFYWLLAGILLLIGAGLLMDRGVPQSFQERLKMLKSRFHGGTRITFAIILIGFFGMGFRIYYENNIANPYASSKEIEQYQADWELKYGKYLDAVQPRITAINTYLDIFPESLDFKAGGTYQMVNKSTIPIDTIFIKYTNYRTSLSLDKSSQLLSEDTIFRFNSYLLSETLLPGDCLALTFHVWNKPNTFLRKHSPVLSNGTFLNKHKLFPSIGYPGGGLEDDQIRKKYGLPAMAATPLPSDTAALANHSLSKDSDWVDFETTVSTSLDQTAIAPGYLQKEWVENGRRYFHYKMDSKMLNLYSFNSAKYEIKKDRWNDVSLEIYYHKGHEYNLDRMMDGMKAALAYCSKNFSPYQHKQAQIIEFPKTFGNFAQAYPNTIPFSEGRGFIADVDDSEDGGVDYAFDVTVHEMAHQWWAHQVIGADVAGAGVLAEGLADYVRLQVLKQHYGEDKMRKYLKYATDKYLRDRGDDRKGENPVIHEDNQPYIRYSKASVVLYTLSDYIGEETMNAALSSYVEHVKFQEAPYTTSLELVKFLRATTPDSLQYTITDMFETITLYNNKMINATSKKLENGQYQVELEFQVTKYRSDETGNRSYGEQMEETEQNIRSIALADYLDIGIFGEQTENGITKEITLYLQKHKITSIDNKLTITLAQKPVTVGVDPYNKLIDTDSNDNSMKVKEIMR
ncbi:M1 family aminopeptidase [Ekhidna sp.]|uniref:ABC transporter permease/M1 family aminopeptidase n=1 Tax=Ekhidna sp. TaxID=2608089 RepID=UPI00329A344B